VAASHPAKFCTNALGQTVRALHGALWVLDASDRSKNNTRAIQKLIKYRAIKIGLARGLVTVI